LATQLHLSQLDMPSDYEETLRPFEIEFVRDQKFEGNRGTEYSLIIVNSRTASFETATLCILAVTSPLQIACWKVRAYSLPQARLTRLSDFSKLFSLSLVLASRRCSGLHSDTPHAMIRLGRVQTKGPPREGGFFRFLG